MALPQNAGTGQILLSLDGRLEAIEGRLGKLVELEARIAGVQRSLRVRGQKRAGARAAAVAWLREALAPGPRRGAALVAAGRGVGIASSTLYRACERIGVERERGIWRLPTAPVEASASEAASR